jgi:hypothetical protein
MRRCPGFRCQRRVPKPILPYVLFIFINPPYSGSHWLTFNVSMGTGENKESIRIHLPQWHCQRLRRWELHIALRRPRCQPSRKLRLPTRVSTTKPTSLKIHTIHNSANRTRVDPSIRITYYPRSRKVNRTGFNRKTCSYIFEQRISVFNSKPNFVTSLKVLDQFPVSEDSTITSVWEQVDR